MTNHPPLAATPAVVDALAQLNFAVLNVLSRSSAEHDLSVTQLRLLGVLRDRAPTMAALADHLELDPSSVSGLIDRAERRQLVARRTSAHDARVTIVDLTAAGAEVAERLAATVSERFEQLLANVSPGDRTQLVRIAGLVTGRRP